MAIAAVCLGTLAGRPALASSGSAPSEAVIRELRALIEAQQKEISELRSRMSALEGGPPSKTSVVHNSGASGAASITAPAPAVAAGRTDAATFAVGRFPDDAVVRPGSFARAVRVPGTDFSSVRVGGFAQMDLITDFGQVRSPYAFLASSIAPGTDREARTSLTARQTRLNLDVRTDTARGPGRVFIEGDFGGDGGNERLANGTSFRLRHAFAQLGPFYVGQYWSAFVDLAALPETVDPTAPAGKALTRQTGIRYVHPLPDFGAFSVALENPDTDVTGAASTREELPDLLASVRRDGGHGHAQLTVLARRLVALDATGREAQAFGYGINLTGHRQLPWGEGRDRLSGGVIYGEGVGRYLTELAGLGLDATLEPQARGLEPARATAAYAAFQHWWTPRLRSTWAAGFVEVEPGAPTAPATFDQGTTLLGNLLWNPVPPLTTGSELIWGRREAHDGSTDDALRLLFTARFSF